MKHLELRGATVPALGLGTWQLWGRACYDAISTLLPRTTRRSTRGAGISASSTHGSGPKSDPT